MSGVDLLLVAACVLGSAMVTAMAGFGFAVLAVPTMSLAIGAHDAVVVSTLLGLVINAAYVGREHRLADRPLVRRLTLAAFAGMPVGLLVFRSIDDRPMRIVVGVSVLASVVVLSRGIPHVGDGRRLDVLAGFVSGVLNTSVSTSGPPLVVALHARGMPPHTFRATIQTVFALSAVVGTAMFLASGEIDVPLAIAALVALPATLCGLGVGFVLRHHVHGDRFRRLTLGLLALAGVSAVAGAL